MRLIRRHLSTATHHKKSRRLIVDPGGSAVRSKTVRSCRFYSRPAAKPLRSRPPILRRKVARRSESAPVAIPRLEAFANFALNANGKEMSTTVAAVRLFSNLLKDRELGPRIVPIVADEARTFGMDNLFRQVGIYSSVGQLYEPEDAGSMLYYREAVDGQLLEEGITEAGAIASWTAAATAYSVHGFPMLPFYIYYSMFGFQRVGDLIWAAADQRARGFLIGATAGRTTLGGEGLQHQDGSSHLVASAVPNCRAYDPAYAYEIAVIVERGARRMMEEGADEFYYVTAMNEPYAQPSAPEGVEDAIMKGMYRLRKSSGEAEVRLLGSGAILPEVVVAADLLEQEWGVSVEVLSVTSFSELAREAREVERERLLNPERSEQLQSCRDAASWIRADRRGYGLCARLSATHRLLCGGAFRSARHGRLRPKRHPRTASELLRRRQESHRRRNARRARAAEAQKRFGRRGRDREIRSRHRRGSPVELADMADVGQHFQRALRARRRTGTNLHLSWRLKV